MSYDKNARPERPLVFVEFRLAKLLKLNPWIKNKDLVLAGQPLVIKPGDESHPVLSQQKNESLPNRTLASQEVTLPKKPEVLESKKQDAPVQEPPTEKKATEPKAPPSPVIAQSADDAEVPHRLEFGANYQMTTLSGSSSGTTANLNSSHDISLFAAWKQEWTESFSTAFGGKFRSVDIEPSTNSTKTISSTSKSISGLSLSAEEKLSKKFALIFGLSYENQLFFHGLNSNSLVVDVVPIPALSIGAKYLAYERGKTSFGLSGSVDYLMPATTDGFSVDSGFAYQGKLFIRRKYGTDSAVELGLGYQDRSQNTSVLNFHEKSVGATLLFSIPLFQ